MKIAYQGRHHYKENERRRGIQYWRWLDQREIEEAEVEDEGEISPRETTV